MWYDELQPGWSWSALWYGYVRCGCGGIRRLEGLCPACGAPLVDQEPRLMRGDDGREVLVPQNIYAGGEEGLEDYVYLDMLEREWKRPVTAGDGIRWYDPARQPSPRAAIVVLFWSYFETRVERLLRAGMRNLPPRVTEDLLTRYSAIGARLDRLYRVLFDATYRGDLHELGYAGLAQHLAHVQERRNAFAHGDPNAIDDALVAAVVENLKTDHEAWIAVFNRRVVRT